MRSYSFGYGPVTSAWRYTLSAISLADLHKRIAASGMPIPDWIA